MAFALVSITHSITIFPAAFLTAIEILSLCTSMPIYLMLVIRVFLSGGVRAEHSKPYSKRGALLYCVGLSDKWFHLSCFGVNHALRPCSYRSTLSSTQMLPT